jgi:hypothetical protein
MLHSGFLKEDVEEAFFYVEKKQEVFHSEQRVGKD